MNPNLKRLPLFALASVSLVTLTSFTPFCFAQNIERFPVKELNIGMYLIKAEVAANEEERAQGLMFRQKMGKNEGMVFDFGAPAQVCMWMKNTLIPLSVAFISEDGKIVNIENMRPETLDSHCGKKQVRYALEMNLGWFSQKNIKPGMSVDKLPQ